MIYSLLALKLTHIQGIVKDQKPFSVSKDMKASFLTHKSELFTLTALIYSAPLILILQNFVIKAFQCNHRVKPTVEFVFQEDGIILRDGKLRIRELI